MAEYTNARSWTLELADSSMLGPGQTRNIDAETAHNLALISAGDLIPFDVSTAPPAPDDLYRNSPRRVFLSDEGLDAPATADRGGDLVIGADGVIGKRDAAGTVTTHLSVARREDGIGRRPAITDRVVPPGSKLRGMNIGPAANGGYGGTWSEVFDQWDAHWEGFIKRQVDLAKLAGANSVRLIGGMGAIKDGDVTVAEYVSRYEQFVAYARDQGLYVIAVGCAFAHVSAATSAELIPWLRELVTMLNRYDHVLGVDVSQEPYLEAYAGYGLTDTTPNNETIADLCTALYDGIRDYTEMPLWFSSADPYVHPKNLLLNAVNDVLDYHVYPWNVTSTLDAAITAYGNKPILIGEWGHPTAVSTGHTTNGSTTLASVTNSLMWRNGAPIAGTGIPDGTTIVSGQDTGSLVLSQAATATATGVALDPTASRVAFARQQREVAARPDVVGSLYWSVAWPASLDYQYGYYSDPATATVRADVAAIFEAWPASEASDWVVEQRPAAAVTLNGALNAFMEVAAREVTLARACHVTVEAVFDLQPAATGQTYYAAVAISGVIQNQRPTTTLSTRHEVRITASEYLDAGSHTMAMYMVRSAGTNLDGQVLATGFGTRLRMTFRPA